MTSPENNAHPPALSVQAVTFKYPDHALSMPDIELTSGSSCSVVGPSGCGKSTLLHLIAGLLTPSNGTIHIAGTRIDSLGQAARDRLRGRCIGMVLQQLRLVKSLTVLDNLLLAQRLGGQAIDKKAAVECLESMNLGHRLNHRPQSISQGEAQRVAIARALLGKPELILADEPTSALDDANAERVLTLLKNQAKTANAALLVVTHDNRIRDQLDQQIELTGAAA